MVQWSTLSWFPCKFKYSIPNIYWKSRHKHQHSKYRYPASILSRHHCEMTRIQPILSGKRGALWSSPSHPCSSPTPLHSLENRDKSTIYLLTFHDTLNLSVIMWVEDLSPGETLPDDRITSFSSCHHCYCLEMKMLPQLYQVASSFRDPITEIWKKKKKHR